MLRYSCRLGKGDTLTKIPFKELFVSHDLTYITGTTDSNITVGSTNTVILKNSYETSECNIKWSEHLRQGLCFVDTSLKLKLIIKIASIYSTLIIIMIFVTFNKTIMVNI